MSLGVLPPSPEFSEGFPARFDLTTVEWQPLPTEPSRQTYQDYIELREKARWCIKVEEGPELEQIQTGAVDSLRKSLGETFNQPGTPQDYLTYSADIAGSKIGALVEYLQGNHADSISTAELEASEAFIKSAFAMYDERQKGEALTDRDGSFAFVVPLRTSREYSIYAREVESIIPVLRYVPNHLRAWMMRGLPPFIADTYVPGPDGKRGYLVCIPSVNEDMREDLADESRTVVQQTSQQAVNDGIDLVINRLGCDVAGLGATLPSITNHGSSIRRKYGDAIVLTTGHGGTVELISATIDSLRQDRKVKSIGFIGLGAIGAAAARIITAQYPEDVPIFIRDINAGNVRRLDESMPGRFTPVETTRDLFAASQVIVSAVTTKIDLSQENIGVPEMWGRDIVDDSQPGSVSLGEVSRLGGRVAWPIGQGGRVERSFVDYGGMMAQPTTDLFGCEAEAAALACHYADLRAVIGADQAKEIVGTLAITSSVTTDSARNIGHLFKLYGIKAAAPQAFGRVITTPHVTA